MSELPQKPQSNIGAVSSSDLFDLVKQSGTVTTWWYSDFYDEFCKLYSLDANEIKKNAVKIRYELNKLVNIGLLEKSSSGNQYGGKNLYGFNHCNSWSVKAD